MHYIKYCLISGGHPAWRKGALSYIRSLTKQKDMPAVRYPSASDDICRRHMRILHHIFPEWKYIIRPRLYIISRRRYIILCLPAKAVLYQALGPVLACSLLWNFPLRKGLILIYKKRRGLLCETSPLKLIFVLIFV